MPCMSLKRPGEEVRLGGFVGKISRCFYGLDLLKCGADNGLSPSLPLSLSPSLPWSVFVFIMTSISWCLYSVCFWICLKCVFDFFVCVCVFESMFELNHTLPLSPSPLPPPPSPIWVLQLCRLSLV